MRNNFLYPIVITILLLFISCEEKEPVKYSIPDELKEYGDFKEGSYWVYQVDSGSNEDSIWVTSHKLSYDEEIIDKKVISLFEKITISCESNKSKNCNIEVIAEHNRCLLSHTEIDTILNIRYGLTFFFLNDKFDELKYSKDTTISYNSVNILGTLFKDVVYRKAEYPITDINNNSKENYFLEYWIAKNIGVVKKIIRTQYGDKTYSLKRYSVIQ